MGKKARSKLPKRIAGVKVPKSLRRAVPADLRASLGRDLLAGALAAAALAAVAALARHRSGMQAEESADDGAVPASGSRTDTDADVAAEAVRAAPDRPIRAARLDEDRIRARAHAIWEREGRPAGRDAEHWRQACREIESEAAEAPPQA